MKLLVIRKERKKEKKIKEKRRGRNTVRENLCAANNCNRPSEFVSKFHPKGKQDIRYLLMYKKKQEKRKKER